MPPVPGGGDVPLPSHLRHVADGEPHGAEPHRVPRSAALDEGRLPGAGPRHAQADGEIQEGPSFTCCHTSPLNLRFVLIRAGWSER